jgi:chloramphenicol 3-O phosphotransferase
VVQELGRIVVLNGAPRSGKSSIVRALQEHVPGVWLNLGVDGLRAATPSRYQPGIGLRPGGERPDLEPLVVRLFAALYDSVAAHSRHGIDVVVDVGHHDSYSQPRHVLADAARRLAGLPAYLVGVRCPLDVVVARRDMSASDGPVTYARRNPDGTVPDPVVRWQEAVHDPGIYDVEVDTSVATPEQCANAIAARLAAGPPEAFPRLAARER